MAKRSNPLRTFMAWLTGASAPAAGRRMENRTSKGEPHIPWGARGNMRKDFDRGAATFPGVVQGTSSRRYRAEGGKLRELAPGSDSGTPVWTTRDTAERYIDRMDARFDAWRERRGMGPESPESRERRINRVSHQLERGTIDDTLALMNDEPEDLAARANEAQRYGDDSPYLYH
jgi:hypothetical protein